MNEDSQKQRSSILLQDYHLVRDNMRRHVKLPESRKVAEDRRTAVELMQRDLQLRDLFHPGATHATRCTMDVIRSTSDRS